MTMRDALLSRYKLKQRRKRAPRLFLVFDDDSGNELGAEFAKYRETFSRMSEQLYDEVWPDWRKHGTVQVSVKSVTSEDMASLNGSYRQINEPTDVLTFPLYECEGVFQPDERPVPILLGDIVFCPQIVCANAVLHDVPMLSELALVFFHGMLHLLAWDHDTQEKQDLMWRVQEHYRDLFVNTTNFN